MEEIKNLIQLNEQIEAAENAGNLQQLREIVAPKLAFQRRDGSVVDHRPAH